MKFIFSADEHLCLRRKGIPKEWERGRIYEYFNAIWELARDRGISTVIHGGDFFDREPNLEELCLFLYYVNNTDLDTYIIDGNHEATRKGETFLTKLKGVLGQNSNLHIIDKITTIPHVVDFIPYCKLKEFANGDVDIPQKSPILITHVRGEIPPHVLPEVDLDVFKEWGLVLAGDLHDRSCSQKNIMYPGSPMTTHAYRDSNVSKGVYIVDTDTLTCEFVDLKLPKIIRKTVTSPTEAVQNGFDYIDYEIVMQELVEEYEEEYIEPSNRTSLVDKLASILEGNPLKAEVIEQYVKIRANMCL